MPNFTPVIVFTNQKGGVGKTTSADAIADGLRRRGLKVLAVDMDPQGSLGRIESDCVAKGTCCSSSFLKGVQVVCTEDGQATVPGDLDLANVSDERDLEGNEINEYSLTRAIESAVSQHGFDAVVVDTQPGMTFSTISSTIAATHLVIPTNADRSAPRPSSRPSSSSARYPIPMMLHGLVPPPSSLRSIAVSPSSRGPLPPRWSKSSPKWASRSSSAESV